MTELEGQGQPEEERREQLEWRWLRRAAVGGGLLGAVILGGIAYATGDDSGVFSRGDWASLAAFVGALVGLVGGFVGWALWVLLYPLARRWPRRR